MTLLDGVLFQKKLRLIFASLVLVASILMPLSAFSNPITLIHNGQTTGRAEITVADTSTADLHVYSTNNTYTDLALYQDFTFRTIVHGHSFLWPTNLISFRAKPWGELGSDSTSNSYALSNHIAVKSVDSNTQYHWILNSKIAHRKMASFAINLCQENMARKISFYGNDRTLDDLFSRDYVMGWWIEVQVDAAQHYTNGSPNESRGSSRTRIPSDRKIICHKTMDVPRRHQPPSDEFIVHNATMSFLTQLQNLPTDNRSSCRLGTKIEIRTNKPNHTIRYYVQQQEGRHAGYVTTGGTVIHGNGAHLRHGPYQLVTDRNGIGTGRFDIRLYGLDPGNTHTGNVRVAGESGEFISPQLSYRKICRAANIDTRNIGSTPGLQLPKKQLPGHQFINRLEAPDSRLQQNSSSNRFPSAKQVIPSATLKQHNLPSNTSKRKPATTNSTLKPSNPVNQPTINTTVVPNNQIKPKLPLIQQRLK